MENIYDVIKELKETSSKVDSDDVKVKIDNVIDALHSIKNEIFEDLESIDAYGDEDEIASIVDELMEKVDYKSYCNNHCDIRDENGDRVIYK
ncbi:hypothetical protein [Clostridium beijerinckii]|uniref:hypothetical protein n=1 Tax=Clostridium beijerinckii TaxID=1520 RepID=UPI00098CB711|nr:hypothetical protein [Clostridium beijerinckii]NRT78635.1 hypothetical protein [Clostridium beijerinckii]OOM41361.1 hypothetical protein CBEIJ_44790 [Clostridium beijerinckii]